ncbi:hypothetical protein R3P38DRAFT_2771130 [Favolaschia claudopus]|uniref:Uncharacterized protein n=1 Tax=Favolaschia claudopus TaxID=2862362 RepID=A0AAW0CGM2_9AGAR
MDDTEIDDDDIYWAQTNDYTQEEITAAETLGSLNEPETRPKGSTSKKQRLSNDSEDAPAPKKLGRPPGTGHVQRARAAGTAPPEPAKRPVGRPRTRALTPPPTTINLGRVHVPGIPPPLRNREPINEANTLRMSGGRLGGGNMDTPPCTTNFVTNTSTASKTMTTRDSSTMVSGKIVRVKKVVRRRMSRSSGSR